MSNIVKILYNGVDAFAPQPTPAIGLDDNTIYVGERWAVRESMILNGQLTGCANSDIVAAQSDLMNRFNQSFQSLAIWQQEGAVSGLVYQKDLVEIESIKFNDNQWWGVMPYTITLSCYPSGLFSGAFGILNPQDSWSYQEQQNASLDAVHTISCQPINTSVGASNALSNARTWAFARTGANSAVTPIFISGVNTSRFCLLTQSETIDRFNGTYSLTENYTNDLARTSYGVIRYTTTIESGANIISVNLQGRAQGCGQNITGLRYAFNNLDKFAIAVNSYQSIFNRSDLNPLALSQSFSEDPYNTTIDFNYSYDNSNLPSVWFDYTVDMSVGVNGLITASIQGLIQARGGDLADKLARCKGYATTVNLYNLVWAFYRSFDASSIVALSPIPVSQGQSNNETNGTVSLNAVFNNRLQTSSLFDTIDYTVTVTPPIAKYDAKPILNGLGTYSVVNLNYRTRGTCVVNGRALVNRNFPVSAGVSVIKQMGVSLFGQYGSFAYASLDQDDITTYSNNQLITFSFTWSYGP